MEDAPLRLARWIRARYSAPEPLTHLKLQKLCFYCYGAALAFGRDDDIGSLTFEPWKHGPVNRAVWSEYKDYGANGIPRFAEAPRYVGETEEILLDVLSIYGVLDAWTLRLQSHLERPWLKASESGQQQLSEFEIRDHFSKKFTPGYVRPPEYLADLGSLRLDRIPGGVFPSLKDLAQAVRGGAS
jgi:uncharacterized phage-associated protein